MNAPQTIVIIGAGQAGGWVAKTLRDGGFTGSIDLIGEERLLPYERPPLSKAVLTGAATPDSARLWPADAFASLAVNHHAGMRATRIDLKARTVTGDDGTVFAYDRLVLATGSRVRALAIPGAATVGVHYLRTLADCAAIRDGLRNSRRVLVIGGGWIGLEVAASIRKLGLEAIVVEVGPRLCGRALPPELADYLLQLHRGHGVDVRLDCGIASLESAAGVITARLSGGDELTADLVVAGIGIVPNTELAEAAGLRVDNGIVVDATGQTSDSAIYACGDVTKHDSPCLGRQVRLESWANAQNQAIVVAKALLGEDVRYGEVPWFWSDQYDMNLQMIGLPVRWREPVIRGDMTSGSFTAFYLDGTQLEAVIAVNNARDIMVARRLMERRKPVAAGELVDPAVRLQALLKR